MLSRKSSTVSIDVPTEASTSPSATAPPLPHAVDDIERLEKYTLQDAVQYDYFRDRWTDWNDIQNHIPMDFGGSPDMFLKKNDNFEMTRDGYTYLLSVSEYLPSGSEAPFELVEESIKDLFANENRVEYDRTDL